MDVLTIGCICGVLAFWIGYFLGKKDGGVHQCQCGGHGSEQHQCCCHEEKYDEDESRLYSKGVLRIAASAILLAILAFVFWLLGKV